MMDTDRLAPFSCSASTSRGRRHDEPASPTRSPYQRDRDRIVHSAAFRRLKHKTQVFVFHEGDHYRTRLTHSLEVAQIARSIARTLRIDEDLTEALALAHDLGHPPFGHAGERALNECMAPYGGFDHNIQSVRIVTRLECRYAGFDGLNLTWETLEGLIKHNGPVSDAGPYGELTRDWDMQPAHYASLEAQIAAASDDIAYDSHDLDDGLRAGLFSLPDIAHLPLVNELVRALNKAYPGLEQTRLIHETLRRLITATIEDLTRQSAGRLEELAPQSPDDIRAAGRPMAVFSGDMAEAQDAIKAFLGEHMYRHERVARVMGDAAGIVSDLFARYMDDAACLPADWRQDAAGRSETALARLICDFIAGMTDRFALQEHQRLFDATAKLR